jgi:hypothetical protein
LNNKMRTALIAVITVVWAANFIAPVFRTNYQPPAEINLAFMGVVGVLTATYDKNHNGRGGGKGGGE